MTQNPDAPASGLSCAEGPTYLAAAAPDPAAALGATAAQATEGAQLPPGTRLRLRLYLGDSLMLGPGKADLLTAILRTGSIAAAGRGMGMSYKRAWSLVEELNAAFAAPLVSSSRGGPGGGGAEVTALGQEVLVHYRAVEAAAMAAAAPHLTALLALQQPVSPSPAAEA